jgi:glucosamine--fructose-6-phosphate aminotransferase (isomerizing)
MCGIVGYVGPREARPLLLAGLEKLEYRGYDSAGISVIQGDRIDAVRAVGNLSALRTVLDAELAALPDADVGAPVAVAEAPSEAGTGIGHTRWATHGRVTTENAHPHFDTTDRVHIVVNGIVENYIALKARLMEQGAVFTSETDAEVIAHLVAHHYDGDLVEAVRAAYAELRGHYAFVAMSADEPGLLVGARRECPLIIGRGDGEQFIASAIPAFLAHTRRVQYIGDDELVVMTADDVRFLTPHGDPVEHEIEEIDWDADTAEKQGYDTFMLKEIYEQADAVAETIGERAARGWGIDLGDLSPPPRPAGDRRRAAQARAADRDRRLRHGLPRRPDRPVRDRAVGAHPGRGRCRLRVPLPRPRARPRRPRDRDLAVGRDARHARRDAHRP